MTKKAFRLLVLAMLGMIPAIVWAEQVSDTLLGQMAKDDKSIRECLVKIGPSQLKRVLEARYISLRQGTGTDFIIEAIRNPEGCFICGARRCCQWVYGQVGGQYRLLLTECAADKIVPLNRFTRGFRDFKIIYPAGNNYPAFYEIYVFDGKHYIRKGKPKEG